jgi:hypothetical protein
MKPCSGYSETQRSSKGNNCVPSPRNKVGLQMLPACLESTALKLHLAKADTKFDDLLHQLYTEAEFLKTTLHARLVG